MMLAAGPVGAIAAGALVLAALLASFMGGGCGQACIESSQAEQIYEAAADDLYAVMKAGMITAIEAITGMQNFLQAGQQHLQQLLQGGDKKASDGLSNMVKVIQAEIAAARSGSATRTAVLDFNNAQSLFVQGGTHTWYPSSAAAGAQLALAYLQSLPVPRQSPIDLSSGGLAAPGAGTSAGIAVGGVNFSPTEIVVGLAVLVGGAWLFWGR